MKSRSFVCFSRIALSALTLSMMIPQVGMSENSPAYNLVTQVQKGDGEEVEEQLYDIADDIDESKDPVATARQFLESILLEVNKQTGSHFTFEEICQFAKDKIDLFDIPQDEQEIFLKTIDLLLAKDPATVQSIQSEIDHLLEPTIEMGVGHKHHHHHHRKLKKMIIISAAVMTVVLVSTVSPIAAPLAIEGARNIIQMTLAGKL